MWEHVEVCGTEDWLTPSGTDAIPSGLISYRPFMRPFLAVWTPSFQVADAGPCSPASFLSVLQLHWCVTPVCQESLRSLSFASVKSLLRLGQTERLLEEGCLLEHGVRALSGPSKP